MLKRSTQRLSESIAFKVVIVEHKSDSNEINSIAV